MKNYPAIEDFPFQVEDRVEHLKDVGVGGTIVHIDWNLIHLGYRTSTCLVVWDDDPDKNPDIQWLNKLSKIEA